MKKSILLLLVLSSLAGISQQGKIWCGTEMDVAYWQQFKQKDRTNQYFDAQERGGINWIPVYYHIITKDDGTGGVSYKPIFETHCEMNTIYNPFNIGFYIKGMDTIKNTTLWNYQSQFLGYQAFSQYNKPNSCNAYINGNLPGLCGFATFPGTAPNGGGIFLNTDCMGAGTTTFAHEMGHYLGLPHTFETSDGVEFVDGTNCSTAGDLFCDTPADFVDYRAPCPYNGLQTDPKGDFYNTVIDETLYMSYFSDACTNKFSNQQKAEMNDVLINQRANLLNQTLPDLNPLPVTTFTSPDANDSTLVGTITVRWNSIPNARYYFFRFQSATSSIIYADTVVTDTFFTISGLAPGKSYKYRVKGISYGNACSNYTPFSVVATSNISVVVNKQDPSCQGLSNANIVLSPSNGTAPYSFTWSNNASGNTLSNVSAGTYNVTITDAVGEIAITSVSISDPSSVSVVINKVGNNLTAVPSGGTAPYTYAWSNGEEFAGNNGISFGTYTVTVTDAKGCTASETFTFSSSGIKLEQRTALKVFPNPVSLGADINLQVEINESATAEMSMLSMNGSVIKTQTIELSSGANTTTFSTRGLASGIYLLKMTTSGSSQVVRISVF